MPKPRRKLSSHRINIFLFEGDFERLQMLYPAAGASGAIREIIAQHLEQRMPSTNVRIELEPAHGNHR